MTGPRAESLVKHQKAILAMLEEKRKHYQEKGGFYESNAKGHYDHALGEAKLKIGEFQRTGDVRMLIKAMTWLYLVFETEIESEPQREMYL